MIVVKLREAMTSYRERTGVSLTYKSLAKRAGISQATVEALGSRATYNTTLRTVDRLCRALDCEVTDLLELRRGVTDGADV